MSQFIVDPITAVSFPVEVAESSSGRDPESHQARRPQIRHIRFTTVEETPGYHIHCPPHQPPTNARTLVSLWL